MNKRAEIIRSSLTTIGMMAAGAAFAGIAVLGPITPPAEGQYMTPPPPPPPVIIIPEIPKTPFVNPITNPLDVTHVIPTDANNSSIANLGTQVGGPATLGVQPTRFPGSENLKGPSDFILVNGEPGTQMARETPYLVRLERGTVLASVKRPSTMGMIRTPIGEVAFGANSDAFITFENGVLRVRNITGLSQTVRVRILTGPHAGKAYAVAPGYELVVSDHKLTRDDLRPRDGILRRAPQTFDDGFAAISQYHVQSALQQSAVVGQLTTQESDAKARRVISDMSRMAAVLNHVQGSSGFGR